MAENKTKPTAASVSAFIGKISDAAQQKDAKTLVKWMEELSGEKARLWGTAIIGVGSHHYKYDSGREGDMPLAGFSPRKQNLTIYNMGGFDQYDALLQKLGKHTTGGGCLYIKRLDDVDLPTLKTLIEASPTMSNINMPYPIESGLLLHSHSTGCFCPS